MVPSDDAQLARWLRRCAAGDLDAFAQVYDATVAPSHGLSVRLLGDAARAEEVTGLAYVDLWHTSSRFVPGAGPVTAWIISLVHRRAVERVRLDRVGPPPVPASSGVRTPIELAYLDGYGYDQVAELTGLSVDVVLAALRDGSFEVAAGPAAG